MIVIVIIVPGYHNSYHLNVSLFYIDKIPLPLTNFQGIILEVWGRLKHLYISFNLHMCIKSLEIVLWNESECHLKVFRYFAILFIWNNII